MYFYSSGIFAFFSKNLILKSENVIKKKLIMTNTSTYEVEKFARNLIALRKQKGFSQGELAKKTGMSKRMIAYYEVQGGEPPAHVLIALSKVLEISIDSLLGLKAIDDTTPKDVRLWKRLIKAQDLPGKDRNVISTMIDSLTSKEAATAK